MLYALRQSSTLYGRTLLGMLLFVWLSMAISPCVMASDISLDTSSDMVSLHTDMKDCSYCPSENSDSASVDLCKIIHSHFNEPMTFNIDSIDVDSYIRFEVPIVSSQLFAIIKYLPQLQDQTNLYTISPLSLTGILRI